MELKFPPLSGGITQGLNDAGIETFEGDYAHYVVRECGQNSLDAAASAHQPVEIGIGMRSVRADNLPFLQELRETLDRCRVFWREDEKAKEFFDHGLQLAGRRDITLLRISDFGTTGVPGGDDEMNSPWFGLVRSRGVSVKRDEASAGAFGIGKDAPLAASSFRTVIYSTRTENGEVASQGICRLATHCDDSNSLTQGTGFIGNYSARKGFSALRTELEIPSLFLRDKPGLDVWIVGFPGNVGDWEDEFVAATLRNFWPAIHFQKLKVRVGQQNINQQTLPRLMDRFHRNDDSVRDAYPYFQAVVGAGSHLREQALPLAGDCRLHVRLGAHDLPRRICMTRKTGMVIYYYAPRTIRVPFAGLFQCDDRKGNHLLKGIEPPCHDNWELKRAKNIHQKEVLQEIKGWIASELKTMIPNIDAEIVNEDTLADLLPDDLPGEASSESEETDLGGRPAVPSEARQTEMQKPQVRTPGDGDAGRDKDGTGGGEDDTLDPKEGDGKRTGGRVNRTGQDGDEKGEATAPRVHIDLRSYSDGAGSGSYHLIVRASDAHDGDLRIDAVTEDGAPITCPLAEAFDESNQPMPVSGNRISGVQIPAGGSRRLRVVLKQPMRVALRASTV